MFSDVFDPLFYEESVGYPPDDTPLGGPSPDSIRKSLLESLNPAQREAVLFDDGPLLIVAGPGSGKTRTVTARFARLAIDGTPPWRILAITFTNKAAGEMKRRIVQTLSAAGIQPPESDLWISTFHSFCARILRREGHQLGFGRDFTIYDEADAASLLKQILKDLGYTDETKPSAVKAFISQKKNAMIQPGDIEPVFARDRMMKEIFATYQERLVAADALDFDDLLAHATRLFETNATVREKYADRFLHILIDEYQDTNTCQYRLAYALASKWGNICVTGDPDQSIYGWRGADIRNILRFEHDFPDATVIRLEQNYRSTNHILKSADTLIANNIERKSKRLYSELGDGEKVHVIRFPDESTEASGIAARIKELVLAKGCSLRECAILFRKNSQSEALEQALATAGLNYVVVGGVSFYQRKEIKDALAYLRLIVNPKDDVALRRVINMPARGIGGRSLEILTTIARKQSLSLMQAAELDDEALKSVPSRSRKKVMAFAAMIRALRDRLNHAPPPGEFIEDVIDASGLKAGLDPVKDSERIGNLNELVNAANRFMEGHDGAGLTDFLENAALISSVDRWNETVQAVPLMTLHAVKGLEFDVVFIPGCEENILPIRPPHTTRGDAIPNTVIEEERRLLFVGMTRARKELSLSYVDYRREYGRPARMTPSRFIGELPVENRISGAVYGRKRAEPFDEFDFDEYQAQQSNGFREDVEYDPEYTGETARKRPRYPKRGHPARKRYPTRPRARSIYLNAHREQIERMSQTIREDDHTSHVEIDPDAVEYVLGSEPDAMEYEDGPGERRPEISFQPGDLVRCPKFGAGTLESIETIGNKAVAIVFFWGKGRKRIDIQRDGLVPITRSGRTL